jgi:glutathione synthase/RimK-type ligase-like ATP-grasp enzyme
MKQRDDDLFIIEVNDNPNIDTGVEDAVLKHDLYEQVMRSFLNRIERSKQRPEPTAGHVPSK